MRPVSDHRSNPKEQIAHAVEVIGRSAIRKQVFAAIYHGKKAVKTVDELVRATRLSNWDVLTAGRKLANTGIVTQTKVGSKTAYEKDAFYASQKGKILGIVENPKRLEKLATKSRPHITVTHTHETIHVPAGLLQCEQITIDDIDSFSKVVGVDAPQDSPFTEMLEKQFKNGIKKLLNEQTSFKDWGGETNDLLTTKVKVGGKRVATAFAFKGIGQGGVLTPAKMGKNGDQLLRLFKSPADLFVVQYWGEIAESVTEHVQAFAQAQSIKMQKLVRFCIVDGRESTRLILAYPTVFPPS